MQKLHSREFCFIWSTSLNFPVPSPSCLFYSEIWPEMIGPRTNTCPSGEPIYRPAELIFLPRAFMFGERETESACWWMVMDQIKVIRSQGWSQSISKLKSWGGRPREAGETALYREMGEQRKSPSSGPCGQMSLAFWPWMPVRLLVIHCIKLSRWVSLTYNPSDSRLRQLHTPNGKYRLPNSSPPLRYHYQVTQTSEVYGAT